MSDGGYLDYKKKYAEKSKKDRTKKDRTKKIKTKGKSSARKVATKALRESLKQEYTINLTVDGDTKYCAGCIIELDSTWGKFAGKYEINRVVHTVDGDYVCDIEAYRLNALERAKQRVINDEKEKLKNKETDKKLESEKTGGVKGNGGYLEARRNKLGGRESGEGESDIS
ncbi:hypothetical protein IX317_000647 [Fusobacterium sp. DD29]|uniref:hypothetical protein n=1 Tax=unclassified Fusobacterium TaxID=2648384 RepID=UPI001B8AE15B|nr:MULTISPECIES: hypothetical protein [unclassified Fusobacterium]MBR8700231.1 hypothetical protein [Fusobacterium sp. DD45]MBR8710514.1 hypothetical protein [Fusobacterium sp. DD28]MBR8748986.1 hypothetical protein [Fusobacterium sp. DD29]MBR8751036.1 hypothetical protein [Fusobacterium sp. DD26]MBR8761292.1 hypothetical protein [Fusobacterium sp. DD25]